MSDVIKKQSSEIVKYTKRDFIADYNPATLAAKVSLLEKTSDVIAADCKSVVLFRKEFDEETVTDVIELHLFDVLESINVHQTLNGSQVVNLAAEISKKFYFLSIIEIAYVFRKAKRGDFGTFKFSLNQADVMSWFKSYSNERVDTFLKDNDSIHDQVKTGDVIFNEEKGVYEKVQSSTVLDSMALEVLSQIKENLPKRIKQFEKGQYDDLEKGEVEFIDTSDNEELNRMKAELNAKYGIE